HRALLAAGYDPFELRNRLTGSTCRGPMEPPFAMAEINLFGEVGVLKTINSLIDTAAERKDELRRHIADFIRADERTHVRKGGRIIQVMTDLEAKALEQRTRELLTECMVSLGAVKQDMDVFTVSREDIEQLVGECDASWHHFTALGHSSVLRLVLPPSQRAQAPLRHDGAAHRRAPVAASCPQPRRSVNPSLTRDPFEITDSGVKAGKQL